MFTDVVRELNEGAVLTELTEKLGEVISAVQITGKQGELTLKLKIKPVSKGKDEVVFVADEVVTKVPQFDRPATIFYIDEKKNLVRENPRQLTFPMKEEG